MNGNFSSKSSDQTSNAYTTLPHKNQNFIHKKHIILEEYTVTYIYLTVYA